MSTSQLFVVANTIEVALTVFIINASIVIVGNLD